MNDSSTYYCLDLTETNCVSYSASDFLSPVSASTLFNLFFWHPSSSLRCLLIASNCEVLLWRVSVCVRACVWRPGKILHTVKFVHFLLYKPEPKCFFYAWIETTSNTTASVFKVCLHPKVKGEKFAFKDSILTEAQDHCGHYDSW